MSILFENHEKFKCSIGHFIMRFAELEFSLLYFCGIVDNPIDLNLGISLNLKLTFNERQKKISKFIKNEIPELQDKWNLINSKLGQINLERNFLVHGIGQTSFYQDSIRAFITRKESVKVKEFSIIDIKKLSNDISNLLTGVDGLSGEFLIAFNTKRLDLFNRNTNNENKIIYQVDSKILTEYKG